MWIHVNVSLEVSCLFPDSLSTCVVTINKQFAQIILACQGSLCWSLCITLNINPANEIPRDECSSSCFIIRDHFSHMLLFLHAMFGVWKHIFEIEYTKPFRCDWTDGYLHCSCGWRSRNWRSQYGCHECSSLRWWQLQAGLFLATVNKNSELETLRKPSFSHKNIGC